MSDFANQSPSYRILIFISCIVGWGCYTGAYMRIPILPLYARSLGINAFEIGVINSLFMLFAGGFSLPLGIMSDRFGRKRSILAGILITSISSSLLAFSRNATQMMTIYALAGVGLASFGPTMMSFVADFSPQTHLGRSYGWYTMAIYGGMSLGPSLGGLVAHLFDYHWVFISSSIMGLTVFIIASISFPPPRTGLINGSAKSSERIIRELLKNPLLIACWIVTLFSCFGLGVFITFQPLHANDQGIGAGKIGLIFGTQAIVNALGRIPFGYLSDRVSRKSNLVSGGLLIYSVSIAGIGLATSLTGFIISAIIMGIGMGIAFTAVGALISELSPADSRGIAMGCYNTAIYTGMMLSSLLMGAFAGKFGFRACFLTTAALMAIGVLGFSVVFKSIWVEVRTENSRTVPDF